MSTGPDNPLDALSRTAVLSDTPRTDALLDRLDAKGTDDRNGSYALIAHAQQLEEELAAAQSEIRRRDDYDAEYSMHILVPPDYALSRVEQYAEQMRVALKFYGKHRIYCPESSGRACTCGLDAALAKSSTLHSSGVVTNHGRPKP